LKENEIFDLVATTLHGLEDVLVKELKGIGAKNIQKQTRAVTFQGDLYILYKANIQLRTAIKVLKYIKTFRARDEDELYRNVQKIDWSEYFSLEETFAIDSTVYSSYFNHSQYVALKTKDAIVDQFRTKFRKRPNVKLSQPNLRILIRISEDECQLYFDSSCDPLFKRGYKQEICNAPINEVLAAGMIMLSGWKADCNFIDPMCGSGTIAAEAGLIALNIAPNLNRDYFGFKNWKDFDETTFMDVRQEAISDEREFNHKILASDVAFQAIRIAQRNIDRAGLENVVSIQRKDFERLTPPAERGIVIMNPPYGERLESEDYEMNAFYAMIGDHMKDAFTGYDVWMISSNLKALKCVGLRPSSKQTLYNGQLECKFQCYKMYKGSLKAKYREENTEATNDNN
jgi:putative N6-adenine-specific DNA methylase